MGVILFFLFSFIMCWTGCILFPKTSKMNAIVGIMLSYMTVLCFGAAGALVLQLFHIDISLKNCGGVYFILALCIWGYIIYRRELQKLECRKWDIIGLLVGAFIVGGIALHIFTIYLHLNYHNSIDPSSHYYMAMGTIRGQSVSGMYFSQLHNAMLMSMIIPFLPETWSYKAFIFADCFQTLMQFYFAYAFMIYLCRAKKKKYLPILMAVLYWLGYPLYSFAGGAYVYWAMGATLVLYVIWLLDVYARRKDLRKLCLPLVLLGCFSIAVCYVQFLPATMLAVILVMGYCSLAENGQRLEKRQIQKIGIALGMALLVAGAGYYIIFYSRGLRVFDALSGGRNTSKNLEMVISIPIIYYVVYKKAKEKRWNAYLISFLSFVTVQVVLTLMASLNMVSSYYLFKDYFIFWAFLFIILLSDGNAITGKMKGYLKHYLIAAAIFLMFLYTPVKELENDTLFSLDNSIYRHNAVLFKMESFRESFVESNMDLIEYIAENYEYPKEKVALIGTNEIMGTCAWYAGISGQYIYYYAPFLEVEKIEQFLSDRDADYIVIFYGSTAYEEQKEYFESFEKVYESEEGFISRVE